jgi:ABC-type amino acid transport/signal transduction systems, periplasmic component/domain
VFHGADSVGSKSDNGSWNGIVALVISGVADIGASAFIITKERSEVVAFTYPVGSVR